ncbi:MAG: aconitate hydratase [Chloroflexi bacterium]|nr:aconitate hydratase [Chloroflexota bacterium]
MANESDASQRSDADDVLERIDTAYAKLRDGVAVARERIDRPLTLAEKILFGHFTDPRNQPIERGVDHAALEPDRVALQDATAQMALLQFELAGLQRVVVPTTVHCDHLIQARVGADPDLEVAISENEEVFTFLQTAAARYGAGFWKPGSGIIHQVVFENYAFPGGMMIGTDSHTPNAGGMGMIAIGVGGADAVDVMAGLGWGVTMPKLIGVYLTGELDGWTAPKDVILRVADELTVKGGTGAIVEYFGPGLASMSATGRGTVTNMGAEIGATTSLFQFDERTAAYLRSTGRGDIADLAEANAEYLRADDGVEAARHEIFDRVIEINLSELEPAWVGPHTPDLRNTVDEVRSFMESQDYPTNVESALIGSCTNSSYEDMSRAAHIARQAAEAGLELRTPLLVSPGSEQIRATIERDGQIDAFESAGATVLANACGPCIGQWKRDDIEGDQQNTIVTSFNRNFPGRNDANRNTLAFIGSPELVVATAFAGEMGFDPRSDALATEDGEFRFTPPTGDELPPNGFDPGDEGFIAPPEDGSDVDVVISPESNRLQRLTPFNAWDGNDYTFLSLLLKTQGKTTTDHISPAGSWLRFRGHLENISGNLFSGGVNAFSGETGTTLNQISGQADQPISDVARAYNDAGIRWVAVGDENYGEGSSREHASMEIRFSGGYVVIARSFARIAETNLKKQGVLALTFSDPAHYDFVGERDRLSVLGLADFAPGNPLTLRIDHEDGSSDEVSVNHSYTEEQITWFRAGSALNKIAAAQ